jgi:hypothetical protein
MKQFSNNIFFNRQLSLIKIVNLFIILFFCLKTSAQPKNEIENKNPNYSSLKYWAAHPWKKDLSDSLPRGISNYFTRDTMVDVFFIHPTTYTQKDFIVWNAQIDNEEINSLTDKTTILYQASAFNENSRVFAPRYRQAHINSFYINSEVAQNYFDIAYTDIKNGFEYYLKYYNNGRPIIIASHSQGTKHAGRLLKELFENKPLYKQLVCAYLIGMPVPENYFTKIPPCNNANETGCFVSWRTYKNGYEPNLNETFKSIVVNPLTWTRTDSLIGKEKNLGGVLSNYEKIVPKVVDAQIHNNILWACKPDVFGKALFFKKNFHIGDINLFYINIRENVKNRTEKFFINHEAY